MDQHFNLPVDRVSRMLFMLEHELSFGMPDELKDFFLSEVKYALKKVGKKELYHVTNQDAIAMDLSHS